MHDTQQGREATPHKDQMYSSGVACLWLATTLAAAAAGAYTHWAYTKSRQCALVDANTMCIHKDAVYELKRVGGSGRKGIAE